MEILNDVFCDIVFWITTMEAEKKKNRVQVLHGTFIQLQDTDFYLCILS